MYTVSQLKQLREHMVEQLTQNPEYRALKAMERFIGEISNIYDSSSLAKPQEPSVQQRVSPSIEHRRESEAVPIPSPKVTPYIPAHRVA
ncbi:MAG: hypothetical protein HYS06_02210 [Methylocystis sp.]|nr:hypothetical protein [Methylocystis sp.]